MAVMLMKTVTRAVMLLLTVQISAATASDSDVKVVLGNRAVLPCPVSTNSEPAALITFQRTHPTPALVYRVDLRSGRPTHWAARGYETRSFVRVGGGGSSHRLLLDDVGRGDQGQYQCRLDLHNAAFTAHDITLTVIEPPKLLRIYSDLDPGIEVTGSLGPLSLEDEVTLSCQVTGGHPRPRVTWWEGSQLLAESPTDDLASSSSKMTTQADLLLGPLTRDDLARNLTCLASNSDLTSPLTRTVSLDLHYPPSGVRIVAEGTRVVRMQAGKLQTVRCEVDDANPAPTITWSLGGMPISAHPHQEWSIEETSHPGGTSSVLTFMPTSHLGGSDLTCTATYASQTLIAHTVPTPARHTAHTPASYPVPSSAAHTAHITTNPTPSTPAIHTPATITDTITFSVDYEPQVWVEITLDKETPEEAKETKYERERMVKEAEKYGTEGLDGYMGTAEDTNEVDGKNGGKRENVDEEVMKEEEVEEGDSVILTCHVRASPPASSIAWTRNDQVIPATEMNLPSNLTQPSELRVTQLEYTHVTGSVSGVYRCSATNQLAQVTSSPLRVVVKDQPKGVSSCNVTSIPAEEVIIEVVCTPIDELGLVNYTLAILQYHDSDGDAQLVHRQEQQQPFFRVQRVEMEAGQTYTLNITARGLQNNASKPFILNYTVPAAMSSFIPDNTMHQPPVSPALSPSVSYPQSSTSRNFDSHPSSPNHQTLSASTHNFVQPGAPIVNHSDPHSSSSSSVNNTLPDSATHNQTNSFQTSSTIPHSWSSSASPTSPSLLSDTSFTSSSSLSILPASSSSPPSSVQSGVLPSHPSNPNTASPDSPTSKSSSPLHSSPSSAHVLFPVPSSSPLIHSTSLSSSASSLSSTASPLFPTSSSHPSSTSVLHPTPSSLSSSSHFDPSHPSLSSSFLLPTFSNSSLLNSPSSAATHSHTSLSNDTSLSYSPSYPHAHAHSSFHPTISTPTATSTPVSALLPSPKSSVPTLGLHIAFAVLLFVVVSWLTVCPRLVAVVVFLWRRPKAKSSQKEQNAGRSYIS